MPEFSAVPDGSLETMLDLDEARLLRELIKEMRTLLEADIPRADPVVSRLFPDAYEDPADADAYRDLVGSDLRAGKLDALRVVSERLGKSGPLAAWIPREEVDAWLTLLTDLRLALGTRLDVTEGTMEQGLDPDDPDAPALSVMHWLGWVQESMLAALNERHG